VSLLLDHWDDDWTRLWWLRIDGRARVVGAEQVDTASIERALRAKYPQYAEVPVFDGPATSIEIEVARLSSWRAEVR
jgi:hypothetical protein